MNKYEELLEEAAAENISVDENFHFHSNLKGLYIDRHIALSDSLKTTAEKAAILSEELGHHYTSYGNILNPDSLENRKQEHHARIWSYKKLFTLKQLVEAYQKGYREFHEVAEYLEIPEEQLRDSIQYYRSKYDGYIIQDGYYIVFEPYLLIGKKMELKIESC